VSGTHAWVTICTSRVIKTGGTTTARKFTLDEWIAVVEAQTDMLLEGYSEVRLEGGGVLKYRNAGVAVWTAYSRRCEGRHLVWFDFRRRNVVVKNPDQEIPKDM